MKTSENTIIITGATRAIGLALLHHFYALNDAIIAIVKQTEKWKKQAESRTCRPIYAWIHQE